MKIFAAPLAITAIGFALAIAAQACTSDEGWVITSFQSDITISKQSVLTVKEDIRVDFGSQLKHGIFRTIPLRYRYDDARDRYFDLLVQSVTDGSRPLRYSDYLDHGNEVIKIGDPQVQVSGAQRYVITYQVTGAMNSFADHDDGNAPFQAALLSSNLDSMNANISSAISYTPPSAGSSSGFGGGGGSGGGGGGGGGGSW